MTVSEKREAARQFFQKWVNKGKEDEDDRSYWIDILTRLMAVENATDHIEFQKKVIIDGNTKRIDAYIPETKVLIEQKSLGVSLDKKILQSGGIELTPYEQAKRYNDNLPYTEKARWIVTSNFAEIWIYDMDMRVPEPTKINISDLQSKYDMLEFLVNQETVKISQEVQISKDAGIIVGKLYDAFIKQYETPDDPETLKSLNKLCVRIVFCLYAEDAGIFGIKNLFHTLINDMNILINFAYKPFKWESESTKSAQVFVTIIGFSDKSFALKEKRLFEGNDCKKGENISPYIMLAPTIIVKPHKDAPDGVLKIAFGNQPRDGGNLILTEEERDEILKKEPSVSKYILPYIGSLELIKGTKRYCIWLNEVPPEEIVKSKFLTERINLVREFRLSSKAKTTNQYAKVSHRFAQVAQPKNDFLAIPEVSTSKRRYIPMGFFHHDVIASNKLFIVANASLYHFGILESNVHMAWMRAVAGRFGDGYNYSKELVYNTFPWPTPTKEQKARIEKTALSILEARKRHSSVSLEVMYGENMHLFTDLRDAHNANNILINGKISKMKRDEKDLMKYLLILELSLQKNVPRKDYWKNFESML